jgi:two-component system cell cycle sensor histidine kinase/response regulator CckA
MAKPKRAGAKSGRGPRDRSPREEIETLRRRLEEAEESLEAIRTGSVDALVAQGPYGDRIYLLKDADRPYRAIIETMRDGAVTFREDGLVLYANKQLAALLGRPLESLMGGNLFDLAGSGKEDLKRLVADIAPDGARGDMTFGGHAQPLVLNVSLTPMEFDGLRVLLGVVADVTEERRQERQVRQSEQIESLGRLAGGIAHDLNNILQPIIVNAELLLEDMSPDDTRRAMAENLLEAAHRQKSLVRRVLSFTRQAKPTPRPVAVTPVAAEALRLLRPSLPGRIETQFIAESSADVVLGDPAELHELITHLCIHAADALQATGGTIEVSLRDAVLTRENPKLELTPGRYLKLTVRDNGCGIPACNLERIFEPFFTTKEDGTGIGLPVVRGIVKKHRGRILVESEVGKGTAVTVFLPSGDVSQTGTSGLAGNPRNKASGRRILVVDDEAAILETMRRALVTMRHKPTAVKDASQALALFRSLPGRFDLALIDQNMPGMSGLQLAAELHKIDPRLPIILATGYSKAVEDASLHEAGVCAVMMKPASLKELASAVEKALEEGSSG